VGTAEAAGGARSSDNAITGRLLIRFPSRTLSDQVDPPDRLEMAPHSTA
jgi:hypothetical protein